MAANITDLMSRVTDSNSGRPIIGELASPGKALAAASINLAAATNWTTESAIHFSIYETTTVGNLTVKDTTTQTDWKGTLSGTTIGNLTITGGTDRAYTAGAIVEITPTARYAKDMYDWAMAGHNQNGTHKVFTESNLIPEAALQSESVSNAKLKTTTGELGGAWQSWTPTFTNMSGGTLNYAKYNKIGKTVKFRLQYTMTGANISGGIVSLTLPVDAHGDYTASAIPIPVGNAMYYDANAAWMLGFCYTLGSTTNLILTAIGTASSFGNVAGLTATSPFTWASGDKIIISGEYEAA